MAARGEARHPGVPPDGLILASTSSGRRALMDALGVAYRALKPDFIETSEGETDPVALSRRLALGKAQAVARQFPDARIIGSDQVCAFEGELWGKPLDLADARRKLQRLSGQTHTLVTAVALVGRGATRVEHEQARLTMFPLSPEEIDGYLATGEWEGCAGGYQIEHRGLALFQRIDGDLNTIRGLPMTLLVGMLREAGVRLLG
jgi:septum formation protein